MWSWFKRFMAPDTSATQPKVTHEEAYQGYRILVQPRPEGHQFRVAAQISRLDRPELCHHMIRADLCPNLQIATEHSRHKARQAIDQLGDQLFQRTQSQ